MHAHEQLFTSLDRSIVSVDVGISVQDAVSHYLQTVHVKYLSSRTVEEYSYELHAFAQWCAQKSVVQDTITKQWSVVSGETILRQINDQGVCLFLEHLKVTHFPHRKTSAIISNYTLAGYVRVIKTFLMWCLLDDYYGQHIKPVTIYRIKKPPVIRRPIEIFSRGQIDALFAACEKEESEYLQVRDQEIIAVFLDTGIRITELIELRMGNVYLDPRDANMKVLGKGGKWGEVGLGVKTQEYLQKYISMFRESAITAGSCTAIRKTTKTNGETRITFICEPSWESYNKIRTLESNPATWRAGKY
jgi:integrase/recombinase XerD